MPNTIQVKRGLEANRASVTPAAGEFLYTTDTKSVFVGDGTTAGGKQVGGSGGAYTEYLSRSTDITLILANVGRIIVEPTVSIMIQLPVATTLVEGNTFQITNISEQVNVFVKSSDGTYQAFVAAGQTVNITVENISTAAGVWVADNPNYGFSSPVSFGYTSTYTPYIINNATAAISATKMIRINYSTGTGLTATIITKSGSTITKGSEQFLLNLGSIPSVIANGVFNVVMTSATTGIISTIGNNINSATSVLLYTFSINGSDVVQITGLDSFPATQAANKNGISITMLSATSAVIIYQLSGEPNSRVITLSGGLITAISGAVALNPANTEDVAFPQVVALSATLVVTGWFEQYASPNDFYIQAGSISGTTITWGTPVLQASATTTNTNSYGISRLSATEFIVSIAKSATVLSNYGSVSGTIITLGAQDTYTGAGVYSVMSYPISSTSALVVFTDIITSTLKPAAFVLTKSGTALTRGTTYTLATSPASTPSNASPHSLKGFVAFNVIQQPATDFYMDYATTTRVFAVPLSVSGTVVTPVTGVLVTPENITTTIGQVPSICTLSKTRAIAFVNYSVSPDGISGSRLYLLDTSGARPVVLATSSTISTAAVFCAGQLTATRAIIAYAINFNTAPTIGTLDITGDVFTFNATITGASLIGHRPAIRKVSPTKAMLYLTQTTTDHRIYNIAISGTTLTQSPSYVSTGDAASQANTSRRILYNYGDVGYFLRFESTPRGNIVMFDVSGVSPVNEVVSQTFLTTAILPTYTALSGAGTILGLGPQSSGVMTTAIYATIDGVPGSFQNQIAIDFDGAGITMPFSANSVMICGNSINSYGKLTITPARAATFTNNTLLTQTRTFAPNLAMHEPIQDWVDGDYFAPNTNKILFMGRNLMNLNYEIYHVFDKGAAQ